MIANAGLNEVSKTLVFELAGNVIGGWLMDYWTVAIGLLLVLVVKGWGMPKCPNWLTRFNKDLERAIYARKAEDHRQDPSVELPTRDEISTKLALTRRTLLRRGVIAIGVVGGGVRLAQGSFIEGRLKCVGLNQMPISLACISDSQKATIACRYADDSGHFKIDGLYPDNYFIFAYRWSTDGTADWLRLSRSMGFFENCRLGDIPFPAHSGTSKVFDLVHFKSGSATLTDEADSLLTDIKQQLGRENAGILVIEGRTSAAAGTDGSFDNYALACNRCSTVKDFLRLSAKGWTVVNVPMVQKPEKVQLLDVSVMPAEDPEWSARLIVLRPKPEA
ncbi:MAG: hypothetical protein V4599_14280 [Verrucomicrobiota bacterium]